MAALTRAPVELALPMAGRSSVRNSPASRVPSHGIDSFGLTYAIDLVPVDESNRSAPRGLRSWLWSEPPEAFVGFGRPVHAPAAGVVVASHDGEDDGVARRAPLVGLRYMLTQAGRVREGVTAVAGNHVVIELDDGAGYLWVVHLRRGSVRAAVGDRLAVGDQLGECGSSGNTTEPHVHLQVADSADWTAARGVPIAFTDYRMIDRRGGGAVQIDSGMPHDGDVVEPR